MQITKHSLIKAIDLAISTHDKAEVDWDKAVAKWEVERRKTWVTERLPFWKDQRDKLTKLIRNNEPITRETFQEVVGDSWGRGTRDGVYFIENASPPRELYGVNPPKSINRDRLLALKGALEAITDETISHTQLAQLGYKNVEWIFAAAVANGGVPKS